MPVATWMLLAAYVVEFLLFTFLRNLFGPFVSPVLLWLAGIVFALSGLWVFRGVKPPTLKPLSGWRILGTLLPMVAFGLFARRVARMLGRSIIDPAQSDVIPSIEIMLRRWLAGELVYVPILDFDYVIYPTYLPLMWMPFAPAELLHFDYRWIAFGGFVVAVLAGTVLLLRRGLPLLSTLTLSVVPLLLMQAVLQTASTTITSTVELLIVGFYLLLAYSMWRGPWWAQAIALTLCLLSRFSLVFWVPMWFGLVWQNRGRVEALRVAGLTAALVLAIYIVPFLSHDWGAFARAQITYTEAAIGEWETVAPELPEHLYKGVGLAVLFLRFAPGTLAEQVQLVRLVHAGVCIAVVLASAFYWFKYRPRIDYRIYSLLTLKLYLVTFYAFVQVPYVYLTLVGVSLAWPILLLLPATRSSAANHPEILAPS